MSSKHMAASSYSQTFVEDPDNLPDDKRYWWCDNCGALFDRHYAETDYKFCYNCEQRDAVLIECKPVGPGAAEIGGNNE